MSPFKKRKTLTTKEGDRKKKKATVNLKSVKLKAQLTG